MQDGVLHAADVLVYGQPVAQGFHVEGGLVVTGVGITGEVPRGFHKGIHRVGFALGRAAALRAGAVVEFGRMGQGGLAVRVRLHVQRQADGKLVFGHGNHAALVAIDYRDGRAPITLAGNIPVAEAPVGGALALAGRFQH